MDHCSCESRKALDTLKTARGQIDGIIRMVEEDRYCIDVSKQILARLPPCSRKPTSRSSAST